MKNNDNLFTQFTNPFKRVDEILRQVKIGPGLTDQERSRFLQFIVKWAVIFALAISEVKQVDNAIHHLDIPPGMRYSMKVNQKPLMPPQKKTCTKASTQC